MIFKEVREIVCEELQLDEDEVTMESHIVDDLDMDSLAMLDLDMILEEKFGIKIEDMEEVETIGDIVRFIEEKK